MLYYVTLNLLDCLQPAPGMQGDVVGCLLDMTAHVMSYRLNGKDLGVAYELPDYLRGGKAALYPALSLKDGAAGVNFGATPFRAAPPPGFVGIGSAEAAAFVTTGGLRCHQQLLKHAQTATPVLLAAPLPRQSLPQTGPADPVGPQTALPIMM